MKTGDLKHYESSKDETNDLKRNELANDWVNYIYCDSEGLIWLGHYKGVSCFNPSTESFINYKKVNTLIPGCVGYVIQEDFRVRFGPVQQMDYIVLIKRRIGWRGLQWQTVCLVM